MKKIFFICALFLGLYSIGTPYLYAADSFIEGLEDVPVMKGMVQLPSDNLSFGNEESRLVEAYLTSEKVGFKAVEKFYKDTLPQLGWTYQGKREQTLLFYREGEALDMALESKKPLRIRITVKSKI